MIEGPVNELTENGMRGVMTSTRLIEQLFNATALFSSGRGTPRANIAQQKGMQRFFNILVAMNSEFLLLAEFLPRRENLDRDVDDEDVMNLVAALELQGRRSDVV